VKKAIAGFNTLARNAPGRGTRFSDVDWTADNTPIEAVEGEEVWSVSSGDKESASDQLGKLVASGSTVRAPGRT
jgi:hypothetical protein